MKTRTASPADRAIAAGSRDEQLRALLQEDLPYGDLTTRGLGIGGTPALIRFEARQAMVTAGMEAAARLLALCGVQIESVCASGRAVAAGQALLQGQGSGESVLAGWKLAQNLVEACSGIATATAAIVTRLREGGYELPLACTRKNFPGTRWLAADAVRAGGGMMHRLGLSETLLVFPEHRALLPLQELGRRLARLKAGQPEKRLVVEVGNIEDALHLARLGADVLQLERFHPEQVAQLRQALDAAGLRAALAPAGGVNLGNALAYAQAGADLLVSSAPFHAPPADVKVRITAASRPARRAQPGRVRP